MITCALLAGTPLVGQQPPAPSQTPSFRSGVNLVLVDVVVRDRNGAMVRGLTADDFELLEDGVRQQILTFAFEDIGNNAKNDYRGELVVDRNLAPLKFTFFQQFNGGLGAQPESAALVRKFELAGIAGF